MAAVDDEDDGAAALDAFLAGVERRALRIAEFATRDRDEALDVVQDAMLKLAERYAARPPGDWPALFQRILQNRIRDWHRRRQTRRLVFGWLGRGGDGDDGDAGSDPGLAADPAALTPEQRLQQRGAMGRLETALQALPLRQQQTFLLRVWEGLDVADTARAMGCSAGSVKSHYARALSKLRAELDGYWP